MTWDGTSVALDSNADNYLDQSTIDSGGDGRYDIWQMDQDADLYVDMMAFDMDGDGFADQWMNQPENYVVGDWSNSWVLPSQTDSGTLTIGGPTDPNSFTPVDSGLYPSSTTIGGPVDPLSFTPVDTNGQPGTFTVGGPVDPISFTPVTTSGLYPDTATIGGPAAPGSFADTMSTLFGIAYNTPYPLDDILVLDTIWSQQAMNDIWL